MPRTSFSELRLSTLCRVMKLGSSERTGASGGGGSWTVIVIGRGVNPMMMNAKVNHPNSTRGIPSGTRSSAVGG